MGTPSGSKNQSLFMDRLEIISARDFDGGTYHGPGADPADPYYDKKKAMEYRIEKQLKASEANEFKNLKFESTADNKKARIATIMPKPVPAGPSAGPATKRKLPTFVKKVREDPGGDRKQEEPEEKRARNDHDSSNTGEPTTAVVGAGAVPAASPESSPAASVGGLLGGYDSDDSDDDDE